MKSFMQTCEVCTRDLKKYDFVHNKINTLCVSLVDDL